MSLSVENLTCAIAGKPILKGIDASFEPGQASVIVGPNGSGKSTMLNAITGGLRADGQIVMNGAPVDQTNAPTLARQRGVLAQHTSVAFDFTVDEIVRMGLRAGVHGDRPELAAEALKAVGLAGFAPRSYRALSGGEQQRVQLARVLAQVWSPVLDGVPCWLILDEPVSSLDIGHQLAIVDLAKDYAARGGGVLAVMHDLNLTAMMADHVVMMHEGRVLQSGPVPDVLCDSVLSQAYGCALRVGRMPEGKNPVFILPQAAQNSPVFFDHKHSVRTESPILYRNYRILRP